MSENSRSQLVEPAVDPANLKSSGRRARLRDFQSQLMERMQAAKTGAHARSNQLGIQIGRSRYLIDLREAGEIVSSGNFTRVPLTKSWYLGLSNIRGSLTSVVDYALFDGGEPTPQDSSCRVLAFSNALSFNSGILVSRVLGLRNADEMDLLDEEKSSDLGLAEKKPWVINRLVDAEGQIWSQLSLATLVQDQEFLHIGV